MKKETLLSLHIPSGAYFYEFNDFPPYIDDHSLKVDRNLYNFLYFAVIFADFLLVRE